MPRTAAPFKTLKEFNEAVQQALAAADAYYNDGSPIIVDSDYDTLIDRIEASVKKNPNWDAQGLLDKVAAGVATSSNTTIPHPTPMLSLTKATEKRELSAFLKRIDGAVTVTEVKLDGMAVRAVYENGKLTSVVTRGDGLSGEDVTGQAQSIAGLPIKLPRKVDLEVRGEVFMTDDDFVTASANRVAAGKKAFVNPRNATAGTLRNTDQTYEAPMTFAAYEASGPAVEDQVTHTGQMAVLTGLGIRTAAILVPGVDSTSDPQKLIEVIGSLRDTLGFPIDGAVVKVEDLALRDKLGVVSRAPKWAVAWKYPADAAQSVLRDIEVTIGRTGRMALTAVIDPVFVSGATVSRATLHNVDFVTSQGLGIGSKVAVVRANDVIPRVTALLGEQDDSVEPWVAPDSCPNCGEEWDRAQVLWRCHSAACSTVAGLTYWASRDCLDIERLGDAICEALVEAGLVQDVADLYQLTVKDFADLAVGGRVVGESHAREIVAGLERSKSQSFNRVVTGLGIRLTGRSVGRWLAARFHTMDALMAASVDEIAEIEKLGAIKAAAIREGLDRLRPVIDRLREAGLNMGQEPDGDTENSRPLEGLTVVVTGAMTGPLAAYSRNEMNELIERFGGTASGSVSKKTALLVCGEPGSSKYVKAESLGVKIVTPEEFAALVGM